MNRISIVITLSGLLLGSPVISHAQDYYIVATSEASSVSYNTDTQSNTDNVIAVWSDDTLCNRFSAKSDTSTHSVAAVKHTKSSRAPRMSRNRKE